jgi:hypothetical protein
MREIADEVAQIVHSATPLRAVEIAVLLSLCPGSCLNLQVTLSRLLALPKNNGT